MRFLRFSLSVLAVGNLGHRKYFEFSLVDVADFEIYSSIKIVFKKLYLSFPEQTFQK